MSVSAIIEKVQKLLALSQSSNANEAAAAAAAANKLIDQHRLSEADLEVRGQAEEPVEEDQGYIYESGKITRWKSTLAIRLAKHYGVYLWNDTDFSGGRQVSRYRLVGRKSDITVTKYMYNWLELECNRLCNLYAKGQGRVYAASFCIGFVDGVSEQLGVSRKEMEKTVSSEAMIKLNAREELGRAFAHQLHKLKTTKSTSHARINHQAFAEGLTSGKNVHLGSSLTSGSASPRLLK